MKMMMENFSHILPDTLLQYLSDAGKTHREFEKLCDQRAKDTPTRAKDYLFSKQVAQEKWAGTLLVLALCGYNWSTNQDGSLNFIPPTGNAPAGGKKIRL